MKGIVIGIIMLFIGTNVVPDAKGILNVPIIDNDLEKVNPI
jgi:hypothetical protein